MSRFRFALAITFSGLSNAAAAETELDTFFPSTPIHEDDRLSGNYEIEIEGCNIAVTETSRRHLSISHVDLGYFETDPGRLIWPYGNHLSTRYLVGWNLREAQQEAGLDEIQNDLRELRISWRDQRNLSVEDLRLKSELLEAMLLEIRAGDLGVFAQNNYTERYLLREQPILVSITLNRSFQFPVQAQDMSLLAHAMYRYNLTCR